MKVIVLVGLPASGKSSISSPTAIKYDIPICETGVFVYKEVEERGLAVTPENIKAVSIDSKRKKGDEFFTKKLIEFVLKEYSNKSMIFISGCRAESEITFLKAKFDRKSVLVVGFHASEETRFRRLSNPDRAGSGEENAKASEDRALSTSYPKFIERQKKEIGFGIGDVFMLADVIITNDDRVFPFSTKRHNAFIFESIVRSFKEGDFTKDL